jgi:hypothetical protein
MTLRLDKMSAADLISRIKLHFIHDLSDLPIMKETGAMPKTGGLPINGLRGTPEQANNRREERFLAERPLQLVYRGEKTDAWLVECSAHGLQIVSRKPMEAREEFQIEFHLEGKPRLVRYQVLYWFQFWDDACQIGAEMVDDLSEAEAGLVLQQLLANANR